MLASYSSVFGWLLAAVQVVPQSVPSQGKQQALITIENPGMYQITAASPEGTSCEIVDHFRGPFAWSGESGKSNCKLELLLDASIYKLRMQSPKDGKNQTQIEVKPFTEVNSPIVRLEPGRSVEQVLGTGEQASFWIRVEQRSYTLLRVMGRTAGEVRLWRDGVWVEEMVAKNTKMTPQEGQPIYSWEMGGILEAGNYLLSVYGANAYPWTQGQERNFLFVANGFEPGPVERNKSFTIPSWGQLSWEVPKGPVAGFMALDSSTPTDSGLTVRAMPDELGSQVGENRGSCQIRAKALIPSCSTWSPEEKRHVLTVFGPPGASGLLEWARYESSQTLTDGAYSSGGVVSLYLEGPATGSFLVGVHDVPADTDAAPLSCELELTGDRGSNLVARDFLQLSSSRFLDQAFNYNGSEETIWFQLSESSPMAVSTSGELKNRCVLYRLEGSKRSLVRESDPGSNVCQIAGSLSPAAYELKIYGGQAGIERLKVMAAISSNPLHPPRAQKMNQVTKNSCLFPRVQLLDRGKYILRLNRRGNVSARGLMLKPLPLKLDTPLSIVVDASEQTRLELAAGSPLVIRSVGGGKFSCASGNTPEVAAEGGICRLPDTTSTSDLRVTDPSDQPVVLSIYRPTPPKVLPKLQGFSPVIRPLQSLELGRARFLDFEPNQAHSLIFEVKKAGLYHVTSEGLLSTECRMRTAVITRLVSDSGSGRGRNCLISQFLKPGRYLITINTSGRSRGRAGVLASERSVRKEQALMPEKEAFFRALADELLLEPIQIGKPGKYFIRTSGQNVELSCRLEDADGWPMVIVPTSCNQELDLDPGTFLWTQLPITVDSMRHSAVGLVREPVILRGEKKHTLTLNHWFEADLGEDGKDEFRFVLRAGLDVEISLTNGMQGRIYRVKDNKTREVVEQIPPYQPAVSLNLLPGEYELEAEHCQNDVGIRYRLQIASSTLAPGITREFQVPTDSVVVRMPEKGVLRLKTAGETDVRCRIFNDRGMLVSESSSFGSDWNCWIATPIDAGDYRLALEAENTIGGKTEVTMVTTEGEDVGIWTTGSTHRTGGKVLVGTLPATGPNELQEVHFRSRLRFSCALEEGQGPPIQVQENIRDCPLLIYSPGKNFKVRLWSVNWRARISVDRFLRSTVPLRGDAISKGQAALATVSKAGRYRTGEGVFCVAAEKGGLLQPCGPEVSLESGQVVFSALGQNQSAKLALEEIIPTLGSGSRVEAELTHGPFIQRQRSSERSIHFLRVRLPVGEAVAPTCRLSGGIHEVVDNACFAASGPTKESEVRFWTSSLQPKNGEVWRSAVTVPQQLRPLHPGIERFEWQGSLLRLILPQASCRVELTLPLDAWAVQLDANGKPVDLCPPSDRLSHCILGGKGGELVVSSDAERRLTTLLVLEERPVGRRKVQTLLEFDPQIPGTELLSVEADARERHIVVAGAERCVLLLQDGTRIGSCQGLIPGSMSAELMIQHLSGPVRVVVFPPGQELAATWSIGAPDKPGEPLPMAQSIQLAQTLVNRAFTLEAQTMIHWHSDSGVCGLFSGSMPLSVEGMGSGCDVQRVLPAGRYSLLVRPFGSQTLSGSMTWLTDSVGTIQEGIGQEEWIAPGEVRFFRFTTQSDGEIGLGLKAAADTLSCAILDQQHQILGEGCQQLLKLGQGSYLLSIRAPLLGRPMRFRPVLLGLSGSKMDVPEEYLKEFFHRIGERQ